MTTARTLVTADQLLKMPRDEFRYELVKGEPVKTPPAGSEHGAISMKLAVALGQYVKDNRLGILLSSDTGFRIASNPDTVRAPDIAFIRRERIPEGRLPTGYWQGAPDVAVEVISPHDIYGEVEEKVNEWLEAGSRMVIVVNPRTRTVNVYTSVTEVSRLTVEGVLSGGEVIPGFTCPVSEIFAAQ